MRRHLAYVDGLRALAALWVLAAHVYGTAWPNYVADPPGGFVGLLSGWMIFGNGHYAVAAFIVISGFCLGLPIVRAGGVLRGGALRFFARRARRILPPYYLAFFVSAACTAMLRDNSGSYWDITAPVDRYGYLGHLLLVQDVVGRDQADPPLWSVAVEWRSISCSRSL